MQGEGASWRRRDEDDGHACHYEAQDELLLSCVGGCGPLVRYSLFLYSLTLSVNTVPKG